MKAIERIYEEFDQIGIIDEQECEHFPNQLTPIDNTENNDEIIRTYRCDDCGKILQDTFKLIDTTVS